MKAISPPVPRATATGNENPNESEPSNDVADQPFGSNLAEHSAGPMRRDEWSRGRLAPPGFGFECVPTRALSLLQAGALPQPTARGAPPGDGTTGLLRPRHAPMRSRGARRPGPAPLAR